MKNTLGNGSKEKNRARVRITMLSGISIPGIGRTGRNQAMEN